MTSKVKILGKSFWEKIMTSKIVYNFGKNFLWKIMENKIQNKIMKT